MANTYHYLRGGDCVYALDTSQRLEQKGHRVVPFAMKGTKNLHSPYEEYFAEEVDYPSLMARGGAGSAWRVVSTSIYNRDARAKLTSLLDRFEFGVAHLHSIMHHLTASVVLELRQRKIPIVWTLHDSKAVCPTTRLLREGKICEECGGGRFYNAFRRRCKRMSPSASAVVSLELYFHRARHIYENAQLLIAPSVFLRDKLLEHGLRPSRLEVLPNFVDASGYNPQAEDQGYVLYVGRLSPEKGVATLLRAVARCPGIELRIAGTGELETELKEICSSHGLHNVRFEGHVTGDRLRELYEGARVVVVPSEWYENCPLVVLEAQACAKPLLVSDLGGLPELVEDGVNGYRVEPGNVEAWAKALDRLTNDPERCAEIGRAGRKRVEERHAPRPHLERLEEFYQQVQPVAP